MKDVAPPGYAALHVPRLLAADGDGPSRGGGLSIVHRESVVVRRHRFADEFRPSTFELQLVQVGLPPSPVYAVFHIYRPQWMSTVPAFADELADVISTFGAKCNDVIVICGDVNCPGADGSHVDEHLESVFVMFGLTEHVGLPTRDDNLLDVLASSLPSAVSDIRVSDAGLLSDHRLIMARLICKRQTVKLSYRSRNVKAIDTAKFELALRSSSLFTAPASTTDGFADQLKNVVTELLDKFAPLRTGVRRQPKQSSHWLSKDAVAAKRQRRKLERQWLSTRNDDDRLNYRRACRTANRLINESRRDYYRKRLEECDRNHGKRWRVVKELLHTADRDNTATDSENRELCCTFSDFFVSKINALKASVSARLSSLHPCPVLLDSLRSTEPFYCIPQVSSAEVFKLLTDCQNKSSPMDFIPTSLLKSCRSIFSELIATLANLSFSEGRFPSTFKSASITPLLKKPGLDKSNPSNYRPISNLNNISKIIERLFLNRFQPHVLSSPNFNSYQSAYRTKHSTETALLLTLDKIYHSSDTGQSTILVSLDFSAAFDTIDHTALLNRLETNLGSLALYCPGFSPTSPVVVSALGLETTAHHLLLSPLAFPKGLFWGRYYLLFILHPLPP
jgi:hypothetical protein